MFRLFDLALQRVEIRPLAQGLVQDVLPLAGGLDEKVQELVERAAVEVAREAQTGAAVLQAADGLLEGLLIGFAQTHDFTDSTHLRAQFILSTLKFFKTPAGEFYHHIFTGGRIFFQGSVPPVRDFIHGQTAGEQGRNPGDGKSRSLGCQSRRA